MSRFGGKVALVITVFLPELGPPVLLGVSARKPATPVYWIAQPGNPAAAAASLPPGLRYQPEVQASPAGVIAEPLSGRECDILRLIAQGCVNKEIARVLSIAPETVKSHVKNIFIKLNVQKRAQAVSLAQSLGLIGTPDRTQNQPGVGEPGSLILKTEPCGTFAPAVIVPPWDSTID